MNLDGVELEAGLGGVEEAADAAEVARLGAVLVLTVVYKSSKLNVMR